MTHIVAHLERINKLLMSENATTTITITTTINKSSIIK